MAVFLIGGIWLAFAGSQANRESIYENGISTTATPVEVRYHKPNRGLGYYYVVYEYSVNGKTYTVDGLENVASPREPSSLPVETVFYMEDEPSNAAIKYDREYLPY